MSEWVSERTIQAVLIGGRAVKNGNENMNDNFAMWKRDMGRIVVAIRGTTRAARMTRMTRRFGGHLPIGSKSDQL